MPNPTSTPDSCPAAPRPLRFFHRGAIVSITQAPPTRTALQWLREDARCMGTKEGCNEGDCGACTVIVASLASRGEAGAASGADHGADDLAGEAGPAGLSLRAVNACLLMLPALDGQALLTVDDLQAACGGTWHPAQQAMVECHGSQCGFCTPGFVMSLVAAHESRRAAPSPEPAMTRGAWADVLAGNLCRCTGYRSILEAAERLTEPAWATQGIDWTAIRSALRSMQSLPPLVYRAHPATAGGPSDAVAAQAWTPRDVASLARVVAEHPEARLVGGATDLALWVNKQHRVMPSLVFTAQCAEMLRVDDRPDGLYLGGAVSLEVAWAALARRWPALHEVWKRFASPPVRHAGTLGGNLANGSPIGDGAPVLMALDAVLWLRCGEQRRAVDLASFYVGYQRNVMAVGEFIEGLWVPNPPPVSVLRAWKNSKRFDSDISAVMAAFRLDFDLDGRTVLGARLAWGGMAATSQRSAQAEAALVGQSWCAERVAAAQAALAQDFQPLTDLRARADHRLRVAQGLLQRLWLETRADAPLSVRDTRVPYGPALSGTVGRPA